jgi:bifunctional oligoribonuclease and PAP phosphatase NrnA
LSVTQAEWDAAVAALDAADEIALSCHVGPDGDALGSMLALTIALKDRGKRVIASWGSEPMEAPRHYTFLPQLDLLSPSEQFPAAPATMITFDAGSFSRFGTLEPNARAAAQLIVVDHHISNDRFGTINLVDPTAAASAVLVHELLGRMGHEIDADIATCLYTGLVTDTGRFQYSNTTPKVHQIAADLIARGAPHVKITEQVYNTHPVGFLRLAAAALGRVVERPAESLVWTWVTQQDLHDAGVGLEDIESLIDLVRTAEHADVSAVLKQQDDGRFRVSMRSKGAADVGAVCESFGGGGHALAAGFTSADGDPHATIEAIAAALRA